jgi:hypothetical protein
MLIALAHQSVRGRRATSSLEAAPARRAPVVAAAGDD